LSSVKVIKEQEKDVIKEVKLREEIVEAGAVTVASVKETPILAEEIA
jgi:hypothetical protein